MTAGLLYHGTRRRFTAGGYLFPPTFHGAATNHEASTVGDRAEFVYVTPDLDLAWAYAHAAKGRGAPKVLVVEPTGPLFVDDSTVAGDEQEAYRTTGAKVVRVLKETR